MSAPSPQAGRLDNRAVAETRDRLGELLEGPRANPFRVRAYHAAAQTVRELAEPVATLLEREGEAGLRELEHIGEGLAATIAELLHTGRLALLDRLEGELCPEHLLASVPGVGPTLAHRIHEQLGIDSLEDLELAAYDGRLGSLPGFGRRRVDGIAAVLATMLGKQRRRRALPDGVQPPVADLLEIDARYRDGAEADRLPKIAPRRFNPRGEAWLPVLHAQLHGFHHTALYSNTARAHRLGHTGDWVVIFYERDGLEGQCTVVTEHQGPLAGQRVVRGREQECRRHYAGLRVAANG